MIKRNKPPTRAVLPTVGWKLYNYIKLARHCIIMFLSLQ